jgi:hypothetical protein
MKGEVEMSDEGTLNIMFRGLMVGHLVTQTHGESFYEIGVLPAEGHHLRIHTIMEGEDTPVSVFNLDNFTGPSRPRRWELKVDAPAREGVQLRKNAEEPPDRVNSTDEDDFRWIIDLDAPDFYPDLTAPGVVGILDTAQLRPLLRVYHGEFFTSEKATVLRKHGSDTRFTPFGSVAANTGWEIEIEEGGVHLVDEAGKTIFSARSQPGVSYEFVNAPPEPFIVPDDHHHHPHDHFQFYYNIFPTNLPKGVDKFQFQEFPPPPPGSRPHLCGKVFLSKSDSAFK